jgi:hypothetical protein
MRPAALARALGRTGALVGEALRRRAARCLRVPIRARDDVSLTGARIAAMLLARSPLACRLDEGAMEAAFAKVFHARAAELVAEARAETQAVEATIARLCDAIEQAERFLDGLEPYQGVGAMAALRSARRLGARRRMQLAGMAYSLREMFAGEKAGGPGSGCLAGKDLDEARRWMVAAGERGSALITEEAWGWMLREEEPAVVGVLVRMACARATDGESQKVQRAVWENRVLCAEVARMMGRRRWGAERWRRGGGSRSACPIQAMGRSASSARSSSIRRFASSICAGERSR